MYTFKFSKFFVGGLLEGITYSDTLTASEPVYQGYLDMMRTGKITQHAYAPSPFKIVAVELIAFKAE